MEGNGRSWGSRGREFKLRAGEGWLEVVERAEGPDVATEVMMREFSSERPDDDDTFTGTAELDATTEEWGSESRDVSEDTLMEGPCFMIKASRRADFSSSSLKYQRSQGIS